MFILGRPSGYLRWKWYRKQYLSRVRHLPVCITASGGPCADPLIEIWLKLDFELHSKTASAEQHARRWFSTSSVDVGGSALNEFLIKGLHIQPPEIHCI